ncbi:hypothetical protein GWK47_043577 [Chionoecetes opilio]|uniref:Uncharacterized protein n=1 Tax=Chionoecetes opilio TaxID=41210 RepID=A0A8J5CYK1_CHIOP|nr:hypothetical protein GWK47_043577 [Chionoecetes opilio]
MFCCFGANLGRISGERFGTTAAHQLASVEPQRGAEWLRRGSDTEQPRGGLTRTLLRRGNYTQSTQVVTRIAILVTYPTDFLEPSPPWQALQCGGRQWCSEVTVTHALVLMILVTVTASSETKPPPASYGILRHFLKGTYVVYSNGRRSERDMPECSSKMEACNLVRRRYWFTPVTERLCRCKDRSECPLHFSDLLDPLAQHISNRAQLKFCGSVRDKLSQCQDGQVALRMQRIERKSQVPYPSSTPPESRDTHTTLLCRCPWPHTWSLVNTTTTNTSVTEHISLYTCTELHQCTRGDPCGYIREDTLETYYTCTCPQHHLCVFKGPQLTVTTNQLHFHGNAYVGRCTHH